MCVIEKDTIERIRELFEDEAGSCSMDFGCVIPLYIYRMWGGAVSIDEIEKVLG